MVGYIRLQSKSHTYKLIYFTFLPIYMKIYFKGRVLGLFGLLKGNESEEDIVVKEPIEFKKTSISSTNISKDLEELARKYNILAKDLDFTILSYKTFYKKQDAPRYEELKEIDKESFLIEKNILNPELVIMQKYNIEVFKKEGLPFLLKFKLGANRSFTKVVATFVKSDNFNYQDMLEEDILVEIDKRKAKQGIVLGFFDDNTRLEVKKLVSSIRVNGKIEESVTFVISKAYELKKHSNGHIVYKFKDEEVDETMRIDYSKQGFMNTVKAGDLLFEVYKPTKGRIGRDCRGKILAFKEVDLSDEVIGVKIDENIEVRESEDKLEYFAKINGFINEIKENEFEIRDELVIDAVNFKTTGSIQTGDDQDIKIHIESSDAMSDAIGAGVKISTAEIRVAGNVGNGAEVKAKIVEIGGQIHQGAKIYGGKVEINLHKGYAEGESVTVELLDGGKIVGDVVRVKKASGGEIEAKEVYIDEVLSNVQVFASHHIELNEVQGEGNKFIIDVRAQRGFKEKVEDIERSSKDIKANILQLIKKIKKFKAKISSEKVTTANIYERIIELRESGVKPPSSLVAKLKENQNRIKEHNLLLKELKDDKMQIETLDEQMRELQSSVFSARVVNRSVWKEFNEVTFKIIDPPVSATHLLKEGELAEEITLQAMEDGEFILSRKG